MAAHSHGRSSRWLAIALMVSLVSASCGDDADSASSTSSAPADEFPTQPIVFRLPAAGSQTELLGRLFATSGLSQVSPVTIEVSPLPSAGTDDALFSVLQDPSVNDGYIMGLITNSSVVSTATGAAPFEFTDLQGIATIAQVPIGFAVRADSPWTTFEEFAEAATADASNIRMGLTGTPGSLIHIASEQMGQAVGIAGQFAIVPGETSGQAILDLIGGGVDIVTGAASGFVEDVTAGNLRVLATTGPERMTPLPDAPTLQELGYDITIVNPLQLVTSSQVPDEIIEWLSDLVGEAMAVAGVEDEIAGTGWSPFFQDADATQARMDDMYQRASSLAESLGLSG